jgi:Helix-turn-helix domain
MACFALLKMSQSQQVLEHLRKESLTAIEALQRYGTFRLAARIADLRQQGHIIDTGMLNLHNGKRVACYSLIKEAQ